MYICAHRHEEEPYVIDFDGDNDDDEGFASVCERVLRAIMCLSSSHANTRLFNRIQTAFLLISLAHLFIKKKLSQNLTF